MARPRAADDFAAIRAHMEELQRECAQAARGAAEDEQTDIAYRRPLSGSPTPIEGQVLQRAIMRGRI
jgi:hypothetical protein